MEVTSKLTSLTRLTYCCHFQFEQDKGDSSDTTADTRYDDPRDVY